MAGSPLGFLVCWLNTGGAALCYFISQLCSLAQGQALVPRPLGGCVSVARICTQEPGPMAPARCFGGRGTCQVTIASRSCWANGEAPRQARPPPAQWLTRPPAGKGRPLCPLACDIVCPPLPPGQVLLRKDPEEQASLTYEVALGPAEPFWAPLASVTLK